MKLVFEVDPECQEEAVLLVEEVATYGSMVIHNTVEDTASAMSCRVIGASIVVGTDG